jgi:hypothetical protein
MEGGVGRGIRSCEQEWEGGKQKKTNKQPSPAGREREMEQGVGE